MSGWLVVYLSILLVGYITALYSHTHQIKGTTGAANPTAAIFTVVGLAVFAAIPLVPLLLSVQFPLNWAGWLLLAWYAFVLIRALVLNFAGIPSRPARTGWRLWAYVAYSTALTGACAVLALIASGVLG